MRLARRWAPAATLTALRVLVFTAAEASTLVWVGSDWPKFASTHPLEDESAFGFVDERDEGGPSVGRSAPCHDKALAWHQSAGPGDPDVADVTGSGPRVALGW